MAALTVSPDVVQPAHNEFPDWSVTIAEQPLTTARFDELVWTDGCSLTVSRASADPQSYLMSFPDLADAEVDLGERAIRVSVQGHHVSQSTVRHLLADQILPRLTAHDGELVLHAAGVDSHHGAILLVGLSGRGKSTLAASFHVHGYPLLGDDAMVVEVAANAPRCRSLYRSLRLFPDSVNAVFQSPRSYVSVAHYTDKQSIVDLEETGSTEPQIPVRAIYCLAQSDDADVEARPIAPAEACMTLVEHSFTLDPTDRARAEVRLRQAAALVATVPVLEIAYRREFSLLSRLRQVILAGSTSAGQ